MVGNIITKHNPISLRSTVPVSRLFKIKSNEHNQNMKGVVDVRIVRDTKGRKLFRLTVKLQRAH